MAARKSNEFDASVVVGGISKFAGTLVGAVAAAGRKVASLGARQAASGREKALRARVAALEAELASVRRQLQKARGRKKSTKSRKRQAGQAGIQTVKPKKSSQSRTKPKAAAGTKVTSVVSPPPAAKIQPPSPQQPENIESGDSTS